MLAVLRAKFQDRRLAQKLRGTGDQSVKGHFLFSGTSACVDEFAHLHERETAAENLES